MRAGWIALLAALAVNGCNKGTDRDALVACTVDADCPSDQLCASDRTCWHPAPLAPRRVTNLRGVQQEASMRLTWEPVLSATSYRLVRYAGATPAVVGDTTGTELTDVGPFTPGQQIAFAVVASNAAGPSRESNRIVAHFGLYAPTATATGGYRTVAITFVPDGRSFARIDEQVVAMVPASGYGVIRVQRSASGVTLVFEPQGTVQAPLSHVAVELKGIFTDNTPTAPLRLEIDLSTVPPPPPPPPQPTGLQISLRDESFLLMAQGTDGNTPLAFYRDGTLLPLCGTIGCFDTSFPRDGLEHEWRVAAQGTPPEAGPSARSLVFPPVPTSLVARSGVGRVELGWSALALPVTYQVFRNSVLIATTSSGGLTDHPPSDTVSSYFVRSVNAIGASYGSRSAYAQSLSPPDQINPATTGIEPLQIGWSRPLRQTFEVGRGGRMSAIDFSALNPSAGSFSFRLLDGEVQVAQSFTLPTASSAALGPLDPIFPSGNLSEPNVLVSAGQRLTLEIAGNLTVGLTADDLYAPGSASLDGSPLGRDLVFSTTVAEATSTSCPTVFGRGGVGRIAVHWQAVPQANGYRLFRRPVGGAQVLLAETRQTSFVDEGLQTGDVNQYSVEAIGACTSAWQSLSPAGVVADAGAPIADGTVQPAHTLAQVFTVQRSGWAALIVFSAAAGDPQATRSDYFELRDASGKTLASTTFEAFPCCALPGSLDPGRLDQAFADISVTFNLNFLILQAGQQLTLWTPSSLIFATGPATSSTGALSVDGVEQPGRALTFSLYEHAP